MAQPGRARRRRQTRQPWLALGLTVAAALAAGGCAASDPAARSSVSPPATVAAGQSSATSTAMAGTTSPRGTQCPAVPAVSPQGPAARIQVLREGGSGTPKVSAVVYPRPSYTGRLWSQWGQGVVLADGRFLSALGDHQGVDGNAFLFVYEPDRGQLTRFADVLSLVDHDAGAFGYGKIHAPMVQIACDSVVFATYWGTRTGLTYGGSYTGDRLFSVNPSTLRITDLGVPVPEHGIPSLAGHGGLVYGEAVDPRGRPAGESGDVGEFFVFDPAGRTVVFRAGDERHLGFRMMAVDGQGRAYLAMTGHGLLRYDPGGKLVVHGAALPDGWLRASTAPAADGTVYGVTTQPERYVAIRPDGRVDDLGPAEGYIASIALTPSGDELLAVPGAHGDSWRSGSPLVAINVATGQRREVVKLAPLVQQRLGLVLGGTYNLAVDQRSGRIFIGFNAGATTDNPWGEVVLVTVEP